VNGGADIRTRWARKRGLVLVTNIAFVGTLLGGSVALAARGDCSQPLSDGTKPIASDCLYILRTAVGSEACSPACICAPKGSLPTTASDALLCLKVATGQNVVLDCPCFPPTTGDTTTTTMVTPSDCGTFDSKFGEGRLAEPYGLALDADGNVYVADSGLDKIVKFSPTGKYLNGWGGLGSTNGKFLDPRGVAVGPNGHVYVADNGNYRVQVFDVNGGFLSAWGSQCFLSQGTGCVDPDGNGPLETGDGQFIEPYGIAVDSGGDVYVTDAGNARVQVFGAEGVFKRKWTIGVPRAIAVGAGTVYVAPGDQTIATFSLGGTAAQTFAGFCRMSDGAGCIDPDGPGGLELGDGQMFQFLGLITYARGSLFVADDGNRRVQWFDAGGSFRAKWGSECCLFDGIGCVDPDGDGPLAIGDGQLCTPTGVAVDAAGRVLVADMNARVQRFSCPDLP
jgi:tripartite motif-containing protein 71